MHDDPIAVLERELVEAARRRADGRGSSRPFRDGQIIGGLATGAVLAVALVIAAGALVLLGRPHRAGRPTSAISGREQLARDIGALRRRQTSADLHSPAIARLLSTYSPSREPWDRWGAPDRPLVRRGAVTPWGQGVFLVPVKPAGDRGQEGLLVATAGFRDCCATAADMRKWGFVMNAGQATSRSIGEAKAVERFVAVVPDSVAKVQLGHLVMPVHDNVAATQASGNSVGATPVMFWFGPDGDVIRRIGDLVGSYRSVAVSPPRPETAASRAAERDPSTPNPVWVTPRVGGRRTILLVHFRVLLNAADYTYTITGGDCRSLWGTKGTPDDSRGHIWSDHVVPAAGRQWCPGTYRLSVAVADRGPAATLKQPAKPFGTTTFVVR
jgi:hypothetical protein